MSKVIKEIKNDFHKYNTLCFEEKQTVENPIEYKGDKQSRPDWTFHESELIHSILTDKILLMAEQKKEDNGSYKFQIRSAAYCQKPLFRFDSDGSSHHNQDLPLKEAMVPTPHFNKFEANGKSIAYRPDELQNVTIEDLTDTQKFFTLFCQECHIFQVDGSPPVIIPYVFTLMGMEIKKTDILADINFGV